MQAAQWRLLPRLLQRGLAIQAGEAARAGVAAVDPADVVWAVPRSDSGKNFCKKERKQGRVPSIVFEQESGETGGNKRLISANLMHVQRLLQKYGTSFFLSRTFMLEIYPHPDAKEPEVRERVLPKGVHLQAGTEKLLNVTFIRAPDHAFLKVHVPLVFQGEDVCPGLKKGGKLNTVRRTVCYKCPGDAIPRFLEVDLSTLDVGSSILVKDLKVDPRLKLHGVDESWPVCKIMGTRTVESNKG